MIKLRAILLLLGATTAIATTAQSTQAQSISPELKATLETADLKYKVTGEDQVTIDIKFKPNGLKKSISGSIEVESVQQFENLRNRRLRIGLYPIGQRLPNNIPLEKLLQAPHTFYCDGSAAQVQKNGNFQWIFRHDVNDDHIRRDPKQLRRAVENTVECAYRLKSQIEQ
jgi:hypothetical protein